ncbi:MAG: extracellular solute-binding protein [Cellulosilyticum sp.]|nr:extracellular solute-binding protein [Cellulosilyticum sp.]
MSKKIIKGLAMSMVLATSLTACNTVSTNNQNNIKQENNDEVVSLRVWGAKEDQELLAQLVERFKEQYQDEATFEITLEIEDETNCKYSILEDVNSAPDVFTFIDDQVMTFAAAGIIEPVMYQEEITANNLEGSVQSVTIGEKVYAYPLTADNGYFMYYNKNYFSEEDVKSLERMLEVAEQNNKKIAMDWSSGWYLYTFFGNTGLTLGLNDDYVTNYCTWNAADGEIKGTDVVEAMRRIASSKAFVNIGDDDFVKGVEDGSIIAGVNGIWNAMEIEAAWKDGYAATKLPTYSVAGKQVQMSSYAGYKMFGVNSYSENREWAEKLAHYLSSEQSQIERFKQRGQGPSNISATKAPEVNESIAMTALIKQSEFSSLQRVGELYWDAATELGLMLASGNVNGLSNQQILDQTVKQITSSKTIE